ncbi:MAG: M48 family metallopeptidase, partial [Bacteroidota bacterium]
MPVQLHIYSGTDQSKQLTEKETARIENRLKLDLARLQIDDRAKRKAMEAVYEGRSEGLVDQMLRQRLIFDPVIQSTLDQITDIIFAANPEIPQEEISIWLSRSAVPNASCHGEGTIVINAGLISRLENVEELAFVICHEIAHYLHDHVNRSVKAHFDFFYSEETAQELKRISEQEYGQFSKFREFMEGMVYEKGRHSRDHELEADAIGFELLRRTSFYVGGSINTLQILDRIDTESPDLPSLKNTFDTPNYPFREAWTIDESGGFIMGKKHSWWEVDSLKTHPNCQDRIEALGTLAKTVTPAPHRLQADFVALKDKMSFELVEYFHDRHNHGRVIHEARKLLLVYPDNAYLHSRIALSLLLIWQAQVDHEKGKVID